MSHPGPIRLLVFGTPMHTCRPSELNPELLGDVYVCLCFCLGTQSDLERKQKVLTSMIAAQVVSSKYALT